MRCEGTTRSGTPCGAPAVTGDRFCIAHSEKNRRRFLDGAAKGGKLRGLSLRRPTAAPVGTVGDLTTPAGLVQLVADTLARVATLPTTVQLAHAVAALVGSQARLLEVRNLAERVAALERTLPTWPQAG